MRYQNECQPSFALRRIHKGASVCAFVAALFACLIPSPALTQAEGAAAHPLIVFAQESAGASANSAPLSAEQATTLETIRSDPAASGIRIGRSAPAAIAAALDTRALSVVVPSTPEASANAADAVFAFTGVDVEHNDEDLVSLYAQDAATDSEVALVVQGPDVLGSVRHGAEVYKVHPLGEGLTAVYRYDTSQLRRHPPNWGEFMLKNELMQRQVPAAPSELDAGTSGAAADTGDVIDLLVAYTPAARAAAGNIDAFIQSAIDNTHRIYANSNIGFRLRLVHKYQVSYTQDSDMRVDLKRLSDDSDGYMDEVHSLRDRYAADLVALFVGSDRNSNACGVAWTTNFGKYPNSDLSDDGFSVIAQNCETSTSHSFAHELGHNQGAAHDPDNTCKSPPCKLPPSPTFPYRYGRCNTTEGWNTIMSYSSNSQGDCRPEIEYFSSPNLRYRGTPTGDTARRDNRRVLLKTARRVANYRQSKNPPPPPSASYTLPLVTAASNRGQQGFIRIINQSNRTGTVRIHAIDDTGRRFGPVSLSLDAMAAVHFNSVDLENGNAAKGLSGGVGNGSGNWRLELTTDPADLRIEPLAYIRTSDGFVTSMHEVSAETNEGSNRYHVPFFNPGSNSNQQSLLRLINPGSGNASVEITGVDDRGDGPPLGAVRLSLKAGAARTLTAQQLEQGDSGLTGRWGNGEGKWRLWVSADRPLQVMSLLRLRTGHLTNLSRGQADVSVGMPPPPTTGPDLVVQSPSVSDSSLNVGQAFTLRATVRNQGNRRSAATTLRYYRSSDATISTADTGVGTDAVSGLSASGTSSESIGLTAPSSAGTYYYGACVATVSGESNTGNNCSSGVRVTVSASGKRASYCNTADNRVGAIAGGWQGHQHCEDGIGWGAASNYRDRSSAISRAESECRSAGLNSCSWNVVFSQCGALAYGESADACNLFGGYGATRSAAESDALSECRADYPDCRIPVGVSSSTRTTPHAEAQSGGYTTNFPLGTSNPESRPEPDRSRRRVEER